MKDKLGVNFDIYDDEYIANNLLKVDIFYRELSYKEIIEEPGYEVSKMKISYAFCTNLIDCRSEPTDLVMRTCYLKQVPLVPCGRLEPDNPWDPCTETKRNRRPHQKLINCIQMKYSARETIFRFSSVLFCAVMS